MTGVQTCALPICADPVLERQLERLSSRFDSNDMFEVIAQEFHATKKIGWSDHYAKRWRERLAKDVFPWVGKLPLPQIGAPMVLRSRVGVIRPVGVGTFRPAGVVPKSVLEALF